MPTIYTEGLFRFFFNSREETRMHVHAQAPNGNAKFWFEPIVALADFNGLTSRELSRIEDIVREHQDEFIAEWRRHFGQ